MALKTTSGFTTGLAQPQQPQSQGTPYNPQQGQPFGAWSPQQPPASWGQPIHGQQGGGQFGMPQGFQPSHGPILRIDQGPVPGTTMFRPQMNPPTQAGPPGQFGQRTPITRSPAPRPGGITQSQRMQNQYGDFWKQAQQMFPTMNPGQQQEMARFMRNQQQSQNQAMIDQARQAGMNQWQADQAAAGRNIQDIGSSQRTSQQRPAQTAPRAPAATPARGPMPSGFGGNMGRIDGPGQMPPEISEWVDSIASTGQVWGGGPPGMPAHLRPIYNQWAGAS